MDRQNPPRARPPGERRTGDERRVGEDRREEIRFEPLTTNRRLENDRRRTGPWDGALSR